MAEVAGAYHILAAHVHAAPSAVGVQLIHAADVLHGLCGVDGCQTGGVVLLREAVGRPGDESFHTLAAGTDEHQPRVEVRVTEEGLLDVLRLVLTLQLVHIDGQQAGEGQEVFAAAAGKGAERRDVRQERALGQSEVGRLANLGGELPQRLVGGDELLHLP